MALREDPGDPVGTNVGAELPRAEVRAAWVRRCQAGEAGAWRWLYDDQFPAVYRLVRRMGVIERDAGDICQEVFLRAFRKIGSFRGDAQFSTWLFRITVNEVHRVQRSGALRRALAMALGRESSLQVARPDQLAGQSEAWATLQRILDSMKEKKRTVFVLHELEELSTGEIAEVLSVSVDTVKSRLRHAREEFEQARRRDQLVALPGGKS